MTIDNYLHKLAAKAPVPGGGSAAALTGALGVALLSMASRYSQKRYYSSTADTRRLIRIMAKDEKAYLRLSKALKKRSASNLNKLYRNAAQPPLEVCTLLHKALVRCEKVSRYCKRNIASDLLESALLLEAGFLAAKLNVEINLKGIKDKAYTKKIRHILLKNRADVYKVKKRILKKFKV